MRRGTIRSYSSYSTSCFLDYLERMGEYEHSLKMLIDQTQIKERVRKLGDQINIDYKNKSLTVIVVSNGAIVFGADLIREISLPLQFDTFSVSSYVGAKSSGKITFNNELKLEIANRDVLILDDILDTGNTLLVIHHYLLKFNPATVKSCVLLDKKKSSSTNFVPDYVGFEIGDHFVVGYGLDYNEAYRNLPYIAILYPTNRQSPV